MDFSCLVHKMSVTWKNRLGNRIEAARAISALLWPVQQSGPGAALEHNEVIQSLTIAIVFELIYYTNGPF